MLKHYKIATTLMAVIGVSISTSAHAYYSLLETGNLLAEGEYKATLETQVLTDGYDGANFVGRFDTWLTEELNSQVLIGTGEIDFQVGGFVKWVPFPDLEKQPAVGIKAGGLFASTSGFNELSLRLSPFASKKFESEIGPLTPFIALPIGIRTVEGETDTPVQLAFGADWKPLALEKFNFLTEAGFDIHDAFTYISIAAQLQFDDTNGVVFK